MPNRPTSKEEVERLIESHPPTEDCTDMECLICGMRDCPYGCELHYHHDGCPCCYEAEKQENEATHLT